jgi:hypothetical protein
MVMGCPFISPDYIPRSALDKSSNLFYIIVYSINL